MSDDHDDEHDPLSERLQGIVDALVIRSASLIATEVKARMTPEVLDELRLFYGVAVRGAALEGARNAGKTLHELLPVPKTGRAQAQEMASTRLDTKRIPSATPTLTRIPALPAGIPPPPPKRKAT